MKKNSIKKSNSVVNGGSMEDIANPNPSITTSGALPSSNSLTSPFWDLQKQVEELRKEINELRNIVLIKSL